MYIANNASLKMPHEITGFMPRAVRHYFYNISLDGASEIRLRLGKPIAISFRDGLRYIGKRGNLTAIPSSAVCVTREMIDEAVELATSSSVYSVKDEIKNGFITLRGGHRIGIAGTAVLKDDKVSFIKDISALNYRLAAEVVGAADAVMPMIINDGRPRSTLIISPPGAGKTTMLRDIVRSLSYKSYRVSVVDERREIAALCEGKSAFDLGFNTDVLEGADKAEGMLMMLRSMNPEIIVTDELGKEADMRAVKKLVNCGTAVIASIHGKNLDMIRRRADLGGLLKYFELIITLSCRRGAGTVEEALTEW